MYGCLGMGFFKKFTDKLTAPDASVNLRLTNYSVSVGNNIQGNLNITAKEAFEATEIRCEINCTRQERIIKEVYDAQLKRSIPQVVNQSSVVYNSKPSLCGHVRFINGENHNFPLDINIPTGAPQSYAGSDRRVTWNIKGVIAVDGRPDRTTDTLEIQVLAPVIEQGTIAQREVIRTVVMIPCKYCQGLMDQTLTVCPNCGAKRTI